MCFPSSKHVLPLWMALKMSLLSFMAMSYGAVMFSCSFPPLGAPSAAPLTEKWYMSEEAHWEVEGLQRYVAALAEHDLVQSIPLYLGAALGVRAHGRKLPGARRARAAPHTVPQSRATPPKATWSFQSQSRAQGRKTENDTDSSALSLGSLLDICSFRGSAQAHVHHRTQQQLLHWGKLAALGSLDFTIGLHSGVRMSSSHLAANESRATPPTRLCI